MSSIITGADVERESTDCDGRHYHGYTIEPEQGQNDQEFRGMVYSMLLPDLGGVHQVTISEDGFEWSERHEEGYIHTWVKFISE